MLAATICSSVSSPATLRENLLRRGSTASMVPVASPGDGRTATQSPTADRRLGLVAQLPGMLHLQLARLGEDAVDVVELDRDARRHQPVGGKRRERRRPAVVPSEVLQIKRHSRLGYTPCCMTSSTPIGC